MSHMVNRVTDGGLFTVTPNNDGCYNPYINGLWSLPGKLIQEEHVADRQKAAILHPTGEVDILTQKNEWIFHNLHHPALVLSGFKK